MTEIKSNISELIKQNISKVKRLIGDKERAEQLISSTMDEIAAALEFKVEFKIYSHVDKDKDTLYRVFVENVNSKKRLFILLYYFHQVNIFPLMMNYDAEIVKRCEGINDLEEYLERLVADESFMIKIITVAEDDQGPEEALDF